MIRNDDMDLVREGVRQLPTMVSLLFVPCLLETMRQVLLYQSMELFA